MSTDNTSSQNDQDTLNPGDNPTLGTVEEQLAKIEAAELRASADNTIKNHVIVAMTLGLVPLPLFDVALLIGNQVKMVHGLSEHYETPFEKNRAKSIVISLISGSVPVIGVIGLSSGAKIIPGIGSLVGSGSVAITGGALTYAVGRVFVHHFESGGTLLSFDTKKMRGLFNKELKAGRKAAAEAKEDSSATADVS